MSRHLIADDTRAAIRQSAPLPTPSPELVKEFQALYNADFDIELTLLEANDVLGRLMRFIYLTEDRSDQPFSKDPSTDRESPTIPKVLIEVKTENCIAGH